MNKLKRYRLRIIIKAVVIPILLTIIFSLSMYFALPIIEEKLPNGVEYSQQIEDNSNV